MVKNKDIIEYKAESHNDIVLQLDKITLINIFNKYFGEKSSWSKFHFIHNKEPKDYTLEEINQIVNRFQFELDKTKSLRLTELKEVYSKQNKAIVDTDIINSFIVKTNFEFPIIKGENQFQVTKGFIDLIVHLRPLKIGDFTCYNNDKPQEFIIEIKKEKDFDDFGSILRQVKEYREYYYSYGVKKWDSEIMKTEERKFSLYYPTGNTSHFCILADKIPERVKEIFNNENIITISLADFKKSEEVKQEAMQSEARHSSQA
jgi:hypothetical protein